jgi:peptidoglycan/LPS O-acetylase OafA/YrhL
MIMAGKGMGIILLPGAIDFFCLGALIAYAECFKPDLDKRLRATFANPLVFVTACLAVLGALWLANNGDPRRELIKGAADGFLSFCMIVAARNGPQGNYLWWLGYPIVRHIGRISYGLYVYHGFFPLFLESIGAYQPLNRAGGIILLFVVQLALTLAVAELSWRLMEQPISRLRSLVSSRSALKPV